MLLPLPLLLALTPIPDVLGQDAPAAPLAITLDHIRTGSGPVYVLVQARDQFMGPNGAARLTVPSDAQTRTVTVDVPAGDYAVMVWHDLDDDRQFDRDDRGMPLDGYAMSTQGAMRGMPTFDSAKFAVPAGGGAVTVTLQYSDAPDAPGQPQ